MWVLSGSEPEGGSFAFRIKPGTIKTIGRATRADFVMDAALVSRVHCRLEAREDALEVIDLRSTNGTYVNDKRVARARLGNGDRLKVGRVELSVQKGS